MRDLFDTQVETSEDGLRWIYTLGAVQIFPDPSLVIKGCRSNVVCEWFGTEVAEAIRAAQTFQREIKEGREWTERVWITLPASATSSAHICLLLDMNKGALLHDRLYHF